MSNENASLEKVRQVKRTISNDLKFLTSESAIPEVCGIGIGFDRSASNRYAPYCLQIDLVNDIPDSKKAEMSMIDGVIVKFEVTGQAYAF